LGLVQDQDTRYSYPDNQNYCYRVQPAQPVRLSYQDRVCLTDHYPQCPVFKAKDRVTSLPEDIRRQRSILEPFYNRSLQRVAYVILAFALVIGAYFLFFRRPEASPPPAQEFSPSRTPEETLKPQQTPLTTPVIAAQQTQASPTATVAPPENVSESVTPTLTPGPGLGTPFGTERTYLIYRVQDGDSLGELARQYQTSIEAIRMASNIKQGKDIWPGDLMIIPVGYRDLTDLPRFKPVFIERETKLQEIADRYQLTIEELILVNDLGVSQTIPASRWLIIPVHED
jgi:LysM repeat protein